MHVGRFELLRPLGEGLQGRVYLALDPHLRRKVALKLVLQPSGAPDGDDDAVPNEALHLAELRHPNVVSVYEIGTHDRIPYLVCEFVEGTTLRELLAAQGPMPLHKTIPLLKGILEGMAHAHAKGVLHLDLSPSNLMVDVEGVPRVMDFGLSRKNRLRPGPGDALCGALAYMSPEHLTGGVLDARTDVYALGLIAYEMLTRRRAKSVGDRDALMRATFLGGIDLSPLLEADPRGELAAWVRGAAHRDPNQRFADAAGMLEAFTACQIVRSIVAGAGAASEHAAVDYLLFRIRRKTELPALSNTLVEINRMAAPDSQAPVARLAQVILCDHALTNKVLKLASSSFYGDTARGVKNVSDAIKVLGTNAVRQACTALLALRQFGDGLDNEELRDSLSASFVAGLVARHLAPAARVRDREQAFICGLFQSVGRSLAIYHFPREHAEIKALVAAGTLISPQAQVEVLGVTYQELGRSVARTWGFPETILVSMAPWRAPDAIRPESEAEGLLLAATFANRLCGVFQSAAHDEWEARFTKLIDAFGASLRLTRADAVAILASAIRKFAELAPILGLPVRPEGCIHQIGAWAEHAEKELSARGSPDLCTA
jgi:serine/threonine protein kinase